MDDKTKELIAIGASVAAHCQPCLTFHIDKAKSMGLGKDAISEAISVGKLVQKGAMSAMNKFADSTLDSSVDSTLEKQNKGDKKMSKLEVYDPPMCCSSGVCGPDVNPALVQFASDLDWLKSQNVQVERFNLSQTPAAFAENAIIKKILSEEGNDCLPVLLINGEVVSKGEYPSRDALAGLLGISMNCCVTPNSSGSSESGSCCGGTDKCC